MTSWTFGLIGAALAYGVWRIIRAGLERERRQALLNRRRDRTGRATLGGLGTYGIGDRDIDPGPPPFEKEHLARRSVEHASTLPVSFSNSGGWSSTDTCPPASADPSND